MTTEAEGESTVTYDGGSDEDRAQLLELHKRWVAANDTLRSEELPALWSSDEHNVYFNANGHVYYGLNDWYKIWDYYRPRLKMLKPATTGNIRITVREDMALITDDHINRYRVWAGQEGEPDFNGTPFFRATQVCVREDGRWKVIHAHFSSGDPGPRPDETA